MANEDYKAMYDHLAGRVRVLLSAQKLYWKSNKDFELLKASKKVEKEVDDIVNPKKSAVSQAQLDWLGQ